MYQRTKQYQKIEKVQKNTFLLRKQQSAKKAKMFMIRKKEPKNSKKYFKG